MLQAGIELIGAPAPEGTAEALSVLCARARHRGPGGLPHRPRRRLALSRPSWRACRSAEEARPRFSRARAPRLRRARAGALLLALTAADRAAARRAPTSRWPGGARRRVHRPAADAAAEHAPGTRAARPRGRLARDLRLRAHPQHRLLHGRRLRGLRPRARRPNRRWRTLRRAALPLRPLAPRCRVRAGVDRLHIALMGEERGKGTLL